MGSKYCPHCKSIISTQGSPNFCLRGCGSLQDEPLLPHDWIYKYSYKEQCEIAQADYEKRMRAKLNIAEKKIDKNTSQLTFFDTASQNKTPWNN